MANPDTPMGFVPFRHVRGGVIRTQTYPIASAYNTNLLRGDAVILSSGKVNRAADDSAAILGSFYGCEYTASDGSKVYSPYWPASTVTLGSLDAVAHVYSDPGISFRVQTDTGTAFALANVGGSFDIELDHAGSTFTGQSGMELDISDTGTGQFTVLGLIDEPDNAVGVNAMVEVVINLPQTL